MLGLAAASQDPECREVEQGLLSSCSFKRVDWDTDGNEERRAKIEKRVLYRGYGDILIWLL